MTDDTPFRGRPSEKNADAWGGLLNGEFNDGTIV